ncbi:hypothetical protein [Gaoshiqia sp. Z1-71]|uniref:hypothetical protein n=1 Tax=Gaoshiqia hydrogeniformans TaxID=3290090 RepID=UPI003BF9102E
MKPELKIRTIVLAGLLLLGVIPSIGQNRIIRNQGFYYTLEATGGYGLKMDTSSDYWGEDVNETYSPYSAGIRATANWFYSYHVSAGVGLGYMRYQNPEMNTFPALVNIKWFADKPAKTPFLYAEGGYSYRLDSDRDNKGLIYEIGVGYRRRLQQRKNFLIFKIGYSGFKTNEWLWAQTPEAVITHEDIYQWYPLNRPSVNFTIGFYHSTRY